MSYEQDVALVRDASTLYDGGFIDEANAALDRILDRLEAAEDRYLLACEYLGVSRSNSLTTDEWMTYIVEVSDKRRAATRRGDSQ